MPHKIADYKCSYDNFTGFSPEIVKEMNRQGISFPAAYLGRQTMAQLALAAKKETDASFVTLPFCHTVEGEAFGGRVNYGDGLTGPRAGDYSYKSLDQLKSIPDIDFTRGRIREVLEACSMLKKQGETVALNICGPFTILNMLIDSGYSYKALRKDPDTLFEVFDRIGENILVYANEAQAAGVDIISYADSAGGVNILGPKNTELVVERFTFSFLKRLRQSMDASMLLVLCPKTSFALVGCGKARWNDLSLPSEMTYGQALTFCCGRALTLGDRCIKTGNSSQDLNMIRELVLE